MNLFENAISTSEYVNLKVDKTLTNIKFVKTQTKNRIYVRIMTTFIINRDLETNKHSTDQYAILSIFKKKDKLDNDLSTMIIKEVHLINDLKVNILLENNILSFEVFDISISTNTTNIESCDVTISIKIINQRSF